MSREETHDDLEGLVGQYQAPAPDGDFVEALGRNLRRELDRVLAEAGAPGRPMASVGQTAAEAGSAQRRRRGWLLAVPVGLAACVAAGLMLGSVVPEQSQGLQGQVLAALDQARSVHVVTRELDDGHLQEDCEVWYQRGVGLVEVGYRAGGPHVRVDDGRWQWRYFVGELFRGSSVEPARTLAEVLDVKWLNFALKRMPRGDRPIDGVPCRMYTLSGADYAVQVRIWLDEAMRVREFERRRYGEQGWQTTRVASVRYDVPMNGFEFFSDCGPGAAILDTRQPVGERFSLDKALATAEVGGSVVAVHELKRCEDRLIFLACSVRPSERGAAGVGPDAAPPAERPVGAGEPAVRCYWQADRQGGAASEAYDQWEVARMSDGPVQIFWYVLKPKELARAALERPDSAGYVRLEVAVAGRADRPQEKVPAQVLPVLAVPREQVSLACVVARVYSEAPAGSGGLRRVRPDLGAARPLFPGGPA